ncbi:hypothetical protein BGX26_009435 [Mortierella sp. AD094]|nr:hypothetical protein BGX26_009435 [Mortierella sp. AD094]
MSYSSSPRTSPPSSPISKAALRSRSPPLAPLPSLSATLPGLTAFDRAVHVVNISNMTSQGYNDNHSPSSDVVDFTPEDQLLLYGAYKQATKGDVKGPKPTFFDITARSKWQAWANLRGKSKDEACEIYVDLVVKSLTRPGSHPDHIMLADEILQRPSTPPPPPPLQQILLEKEPEPIHNVTSNSSNISDQHLQLQPRRKGSISLSIGSGVRSSAPSVYELASESLVDGEPEDSSAALDAPYREFTETVVEEEILDDDEYADEVQKVTSSISPPLSRSEDATHRIRETVHREQSGHGTDDEEEDDEVYQSSEEYDEGESDESSFTHDSVPEPSQQIKDKLVPQQQALVDTNQDTPVRANRLQSREDDFVDEGVFEEEEKDEHVAQDQGLLGSPESVEVIDLNSDKEEEKILSKSPISRSGSVSSGYGGSVLSDKESTLSYSNTIDMLFNGQNKESKISLTSPHVEPYRVNIMHDASVSPLDLNIRKDEHEQSRRNSNQPTTDASTRHDTPAVSSAPQSSVSVSVPLVQSSQPSSSASSSASSTALSSPSSSATMAPVDEPVCPVSKKTASSGGVCPAAMFAQARAAAAAAENGTSLAPSAKVKESTNSHTNSVATSSSSPPTTIPLRSSTEPVHAPESESPAPSSSTSSTVTAATNQGKRLGQGIVDRFSAFRSSLAAVSARAASSALSGGSSSTATIDPNAVVVKDPVTQQSVTVVCPHLKTTRELETEVIRLQTDISVLHERLDLLQESLKLKSESRKLERRSVRGVVKMVLRQGLINAILLLIVFAILYKRRSPIAYAILAYIGHSKKEGEAGWRAFMRWTADLVRSGQRNQQYVLRAGRRNGYW